VAMLGRALMSAMLLSSLGCSFRPTVVEGKTRAEWVALLKSPDHKTRVEAASTLGMYFGPDAAPEILPLLQERQVGTRSMAAYALGNCGNSSAKVIASLEALLRDDDEIVRIDAALAISRLECPKGCAARMLPELITGMANPRRTEEIATWLQKFGPKAAPAVPALIQALSSSDVDTRLNVPLTLACVGEAGRSALPRLRELQATDPEPAVRENAGKAIQTIESGGATAQGGKGTLAWWCGR
jgi:HEAT repeat protein